MCLVPGCNLIIDRRLLLFATYTVGTYVLGKLIFDKLLEGEEWEVAEKGAEEEEGEPLRLRLNVEKDMD